MDQATRGRSDGSRWKCVPHTDSFVTRPRNDVLPVRRVSNRLDQVGMPRERLAGRSTSLSIPDSNGVIPGSGDDVAPIGRVGNGLHPPIMPRKRLANYNTRLSIPDSNCVVVGSSDHAGPIRRIAHALDALSVSSPL